MSTAPDGRPRIAVVAVHGIGDHDAGAPAKNIADLLLRLRQSGDHAGENRYTSFKRVALSIPVKKAYVSPAAGVGIRAEASEPERRTSRVSQWRSRLQERSHALELLTRRTAADKDLVRSTDSADHQFMREQLVRYESDGAPYETVRYEGQRLPPGQPNAPDADVHVYEMYWSDLSRLGSSVLQIGYEMFQLLFHIPHLGRQAVDHALLEFPGDRVWRAYRWVHTAAVRLFTLLIPLLWLTMAATVLSVVPSATPLRWALVVATGVAVVAGAIMGGVIAYRGAEHGVLSPWIVIPGSALAAVALVSYLAIPAFGIERVITLEWIVVAMATVVWITGKYDRVRPGARGVGRLLAVVAAVALVAALSRAEDQETIVHRVLDVFEIETLAVLTVWLGFYGLALGSGVLGIAATWRAKDPGARMRARRAAWTARATLVMPAVGVLVVGLPIWSLIYKAFASTLPVYATYRSLTGVFGTVEMQPWLYIERVFDFAAGPGLALVIVATAFALLALSFTVTPSVLSELSAPALDGSFAAAVDAANAPLQREEAEASNRQGRWLTRGLHVVGGAVNLLFVAMVVGAALNVRHWLTFSGAVFGSPDAGGFFETSAGWAKVLVLASGAWLGATAVGLAAFRGRLQNLMLGIRPVLDAAIDVDNYLREHPRTNTPRARIAERYASLLRYLCKWRDASGKTGYDAIVIVSHSQGTVISADYLSFIKREPDPELPVLLSTAERLTQREPGGALAGAPALYLFTMGSPLRQLYGQAFPHLFSWVRGDPGPWSQEMEVPKAGIEKLAAAQRASGASPAAGYEIPEDASPDPSTIGLERWVNAYRSGDYVGRSLWRVERDAWTYRPYFGETEKYWSAPTLVVSEDEARIRRELCIGQGAHTHYWDATARLIALELDTLVDDATTTVRDSGRKELSPQI